MELTLHQEMKSNVQGKALCSVQAVLQNAFLASQNEGFMSRMILASLWEACI